MSQNFSASEIVGTQLPKEREGNGMFRWTAGLSAWYHTPPQIIYYVQEHPSNTGSYNQWYNTILFPWCQCFMKRDTLRNTSSKTLLTTMNLDLPTQWLCFYLLTSLHIQGLNHSLLQGVISSSISMDLDQSHQCAVKHQTKQGLELTTQQRNVPIV